MFVSTNNQSSWNSAPVSLLGTMGYENTWTSTISTNGGETVSWYISSLVDSEVLGQSFGTLIVSQAPINNQWPPASSHYALLANDESGETSSSYDINAIYGTYNDNFERLYVNLA